MVILMSSMLRQMQLNLSIKQNPFVSHKCRIKDVYIRDGCIWFVACPKTRKAKMREMKLLTVIGRGHKTLMHSGAGIVEVVCCCCCSIGVSSSIRRGRRSHHSHKQQ
jgi:hypothetical protein